MRKRKRYQAGSVMKSTDGRYWLGRYQDEQGIARTRVLGKAKGPERITKADAELKLADIVRPVNVTANAALKVSPDITVKDYIENHFFPFKRRRWRPLTDESRTDSITLHIIGKFGNRAVASLNRDELQTWLDGLFDRRETDVIHDG